MFVQILQLNMTKHDLACFDYIMPEKHQFGFRPNSLASLTFTTKTLVG